MSARLTIIFAAAMILAACHRPPVLNDRASLPSDARLLYEAGVVCAPDEVTGDADGDGITNGEENCSDPSADADRDGTTNWQDWDSDGDGIPDATEKGPKAGSECATSANKRWPCDHDGDGLPDYLDIDSDDDKLPDKDEDRNGDGWVGCCVFSCANPDPKWQKSNCTPALEGCGAGQKCVSGSCSPPSSFLCSRGETSTTLKDTFGDGVPDGERGTSVCQDASAGATGGIRTLHFLQNKFGDWNAAIETSAKYLELGLPSAGPREAAAIFDDDTPGIDVAGFLISRSTTQVDPNDEIKSLLTLLTNQVAGSSIAVRTQGTSGKSHDRFDIVKGITVDVTVGVSGNAGQIRNEAMRALLGRPLSQLGNLPSSFGSDGKDFVLRLAAVRRFAFQKDQSGRLLLDGTTNCAGQGCPRDNGDKSQWLLLVMGGVSLRAHDEDGQRRTRDVTEDLSSGTSLATYSSGIRNTCDALVVSDQASAVPLGQTPISASIALTLEGKLVSRSRSVGYQYDPIANAIHFVGITAGPGNRVLVGYHRWGSQCLGCGD